VDLRERVVLLDAKLKEMNEIKDSLSRRVYPDTTGQ
jgi:hypothetical protein